MAFRTYYRLVKPGIVYGNVITAAAGGLLASRNGVDLGLIAATLSGLALVIASAGVFNNYIDRGLDAKMDRTKKRALAAGLISPLAAMIYASILVVAGFGLLIFFTNWLTVTVAALAEFFYVVVYGVAKRRSVHGTVVGSLPGAAPPVIGYVAVSGHLDGAALILFLALVFWQMPHFYAIAIYRYKDYKNAGLPVLPVEKGLTAAKVQIVAYTIAFCAAVIALKVFAYAGWAYLLVVGLAALAWLKVGLDGFWVKDSAKWARRMFFYSLIVNLIFAFMVAANNWLAKL